MSVVDRLEERLPMPRGFKIPLGTQEPHMPVRVRCAFCRWGGVATTVGEMQAAYRAHLELKHPERSDA